MRSGGIENEVLVFHTMAQKKIGPQLYGVFPDGRIEEYISDAETLSNDDIKDPIVLTSLAHKLAELHCTQMPFSRKPKDYIGNMENIFKEGFDEYIGLFKEKPMPDVPEMQQAGQFVYNYNIQSYVDWLKEMMPKIKHRVTLCHLDQNRGNVLVRKNSKDVADKVVLLDYEFAGYSYRGMDLGNHFHARTIDLKAFFSGQFVKLDYPNEDERLFFIRAYLQHLKSNSDDFDETLDNEYNLLIESEFFGAIYQLFMFSWMVGDRHKFKKYEESFKDFPVHPAVWIAGIFSFIEERKAAVIDLLKRESL